MCKNLDGENLANFWSIVNFAKFLQCQTFPPYSNDKNKTVKIVPSACRDLTVVYLAISLTLKFATFYNTEKHVNRTLILKVKMCCVHIVQTVG